MRYRLMILATFATLAILASPPRASAVTGDEATSIAWDGTARDCPHHTLGVCLRRQVEAVWGLGAGRWRYTASHWEGTRVRLARMAQGTLVLHAVVFDQRGRQPVRLHAAVMADMAPDTAHSSAITDHPFIAPPGEPWERCVDCGGWPAPRTWPNLSRTRRLGPTAARFASSGASGCVSMAQKAHSGSTGSRYDDRYRHAL
jgi:hypothetical protein